MLGAGCLLIWPRSLRRKESEVYFGELGFAALFRPSDHVETFKKLTQYFTFMSMAYSDGIN
jgi:hypothetical protein